MGVYGWLLHAADGSWSDPETGDVMEIGAVKRAGQGGVKV
jgi:hypothetical protein